MAADLEGAGVVDRTVAPLLDVEDLTKIFSQGGGSVHALGGVSTVIWPGETLGLVGESGCGKTTFARTLLGIVEATSGSVSLDGRDARAGAREAHRARTCARSRSCSRTRTRRSTAGTRCGASCAAR